MYFKHLAAAFGNVIMSSVYRVVDMGIIEKYQGSTETVTLIIVSSVWNIIHSLVIGGFIIFSILREELLNNHKKSNEYFTILCCDYLF